MTNEKIPRPSGAHVLILDNLGLKPQAKQPDPFGVYMGIGWLSPLIIHSDPKNRYLVIHFAQVENKVKLPDVLKPVIPGKGAKRPRPGIQKKQIT